MNRRSLLTLGLINLLLLGGQFLAVPAPVAAAVDAGYDCCKKSNDGNHFCCDQCCTSENCDRDADCQAAEVEGDQNVPLVQ